MFQDQGMDGIICQGLTPIDTNYFKSGENRNKADFM